VRCWRLVQAHRTVYSGGRPIESTFLATSVFIQRGEASQALKLHVNMRPGRSRHPCTRDYPLIYRIGVTRSCRATSVTHPTYSYRRDPRPHAIHASNVPTADTFGLSTALWTLCDVRSCKYYQHNVSETGSVSVLRGREGDTLWVP
jgi:hypothetical protein